MSNQANNVGLTQKQIHDAMRGIREAISGGDMPNTDVLELTEKIEDGQDNLLSTLNTMLKDKNEVSDKTETDNIKIGQSHSSEKKHKSPETNHSVLENLVIEALKPQLTNWLNANLPDIVRNIVEKEIKKLVP